MEITGTITLSDGSTSEFRVSTESGWSQWGADTPRLGRTVDVMEALELAVHDTAPEADASDETEEST